MNLRHEVESIKPGYCLEMAENMVHVYAGGDHAVHVNRVTQVMCNDENILLRDDEGRFVACVDYAHAESAVMTRIYDRANGELLLYRLEVAYGKEDEV